MSSRLFQVLIAIVVLAGVSFFWWNSRAEQKVSRQADAFLDQIRFERLSLKTEKDREEALATIMSESLQVSGDEPIPRLTLSPDEFLEKLTELHGYLSILKIEETVDRQITVADDTASVIIEAAITGAAGKSNSRTMNWTLTLTFEKSDRWRLTKFHGTTPTPLKV